MANSKKWSEQTLTQQSFTDIENGNEVTKNQRVLCVCTHGMDIFRKHFMGEGCPKNELVVPFDFIVLAGDKCTTGMFYEMEYTVGGTHGIVYRGLIQAANPCTDIRMVVGLLRDSHILPKEIHPHKVNPRFDIDAVIIGNCVPDEEHGYALAGIKRTACESEQSAAEYIKENGSATFLYYRNDSLELVIEDGFHTDMPEIFVSGSDNVNDPAFAQMREADIETMREDLDEAIYVAQEYRIPYISMFVCDEGGDPVKSFETNIRKPVLKEIFDSVISKSVPVEERFKDAIAAALSIPVEAGLVKTLDESYDFVRKTLTELQEIGGIEMDIKEV